MTGTETIGSLAISVLATAAEAAERGILGAATRRAYINLKHAVTNSSPDEAEVRAESYVSANWNARVITAIQRWSSEDKARIYDLTAALIEALKADVRRGSIGINLLRLDAICAQLKMVGGCSGLEN